MGNQQLMTPIREPESEIPKDDHEINLIRVRSETAKLLAVRNKIIFLIRQLYRRIYALRQKKDTVSGDLTNFRIQELEHIKKISAAVFQQFAKMQTDIAGRSLKLTAEELSFAGLVPEQEKKAALVLKETRQNALESLQIKQERSQVAKLKKEAEEALIVATNAQTKAVELQREAYRLFTKRNNEMDDHNHNWLERSEKLRELETLTLINARKVSTAIEAVDKDKKRLVDRERLLLDREALVDRKIAMLKKHGVVI